MVQQVDLLVAVGVLGSVVLQVDAQVLGRLLGAFLARREVRDSRQLGHKQDGKWPIAFAPATDQERHEKDAQTEKSRFTV